MRRNVEKTIEVYLKKVNGTNKGGFYADEAFRINELSKDRWDCIFNALYFGFMVGYNFAKREAKEKRKALN